MTSDFKNLDHQKGKHDFLVYFTSHEVLQNKTIFTLAIESIYSIYTTNNGGKLKIGSWYNRFRGKTSYTEALELFADQKAVVDQCVIHPIWEYFIKKNGVFTNKSLHKLFDTLKPPPPSQKNDETTNKKLTRLIELMKRYISSSEVNPPAPNKYTTKEKVISRLLFYLLDVKELLELRKKLGLPSQVSEILDSEADWPESITKKMMVKKCKKYFQLSEEQLKKLKIMS